MFIPEEPVQTHPGHDYSYQTNEVLNPGTEYLLKIRVFYRNDESLSVANHSFFEWPHHESNLVRFIFRSSMKSIEFNI
jgi:hypothetical protein